MDIDGSNGGEGSSVKELLRGETNSYLKLQALEIDIGVTLGLHKAFLQLEMATVESCREVVGFENNSIVAHVVVEVDDFVILLQVEGVFNKITLVSFQLDVGDLHIVDEADNLLKDFFLCLTQSTQVN